MKISIVTISYNQAQFLEQAICSVINQDYPDIEYIVVDPGSTDGSREIIEKYRDRINKIIYEPDEGPADGLNKGFSHATGHIYGYLNSDDAYLSGAFSKVATAFQAHPESKVIYGHGYIVDSDGILIRRFYSNRFTPWCFVHGASVVMQQSTFFRKEAFLAVEGFNKSNPIWWDGELLLDFAMAGFKMYILNDFLSKFIIHDESISGQKFFISNKKELINWNRKVTHERLYRKVTGHGYDKRTRIFKIVARIQKWATHPKSSFCRMIEVFNLKNVGKVRSIL